MNRFTRAFNKGVSYKFSLWGAHISIKELKSYLDGLVWDFYTMWDLFNFLESLKEEYDNFPIRLINSFGIRIERGKHADEAEIHLISKNFIVFLYLNQKDKSIRYTYMGKSDIDDIVEKHLSGKDEEIRQERHIQNGVYHEDDASEINFLALTNVLGYDVMTFLEKELVRLFRTYLTFRV